MENPVAFRLVFGRRRGRFGRLLRAVSSAGGFFACPLFVAGCGGEDSAVKKQVSATKQDLQEVEKAKRAVASNRPKNERQASARGVSGSAPGSSTGVNPQKAFCATVFDSEDEDAPFVRGFLDAESDARIPLIGECLLQKGANVHVRHKNSMSPLCHFVMDQKPAAVQWLLAKGADPNSICAVNSRTKSHVIHSAASQPSTTVLKLIIDGGGNVNAKARGWTPLHHAALYGHLENAKLLVSRGANLGVLSRGNKGQTALQIAESERNDAVAAYLRSLRSPPGPH